MVNLGVIHPRWAVEMRPVAEGLLTATCTHYRPGTGQGDLDEELGSVEDPDPTIIAAELACKFQTRTQRAPDALIGEQQVTTHEYYFEVPLAHADVAVNDWFVITDEGLHGDPASVGHVFRVQDATSVSLQWTRVLRAQLDEG